MNLDSGYFFALSLALVCAAAAVLAVLTQRWKETPGARSFFGVALSMSLLALFELLSLFGGSAAAALFWFKVRFLLTAVMPVFWLVFALDYVGRKSWLSRRLKAGFFLLPFLTQIIVWTNGLHHLFVKQEAGLSLKGPFWVADPSLRIPGLWYLVHSFYGMLLFAASITLLTVFILRKKSRDVGQAFFILAGGSIGFAMAVLSTFKLLPATEYNYFTPVIGLSFLFFAVAVFRFRLFKKPALESDRPDEIAAGRSLALFLLILAILASSIIAVGYNSFREFESNLRKQAEIQLTAVAEIKADELTTWRRERTADGEMLQQDVFFSEIVERFLSRPSDSRNREELMTRLFRFRVYRQYIRISLLDLEGVERLVDYASAETESFPSSPEAIAAVTAHGRPQLFDLHRDAEHAPIHLSLYVPIYSAQPRREFVKPLGVVVLWIDPYQYLYPFILKWPGPNVTAETLLVRREEDAIVYLNDLKFRPAAALHLRLPLTATDVPAVQAALGKTGIVEGPDYRGVPVLASLRAIADSSWFLVARIDLSEIYAPVRARLWQTLILLAALIVSAGSGLGMLWRRQRLRYFRSRAEIGRQLRESLERFELANRATFDVVWDWDLRTNAIWRNEHLRSIFGFEPEELEEGVQSWKKRVHPEDRDRVYSGIQAVIEGGGQFWSDHYRFRHKDGRYLNIFDRGFVRRDEAGQPVRMIGAMQDLTERISAEKAVLHSRDLMRYIIEHNRSAVAVHDRRMNYLYVSQRYLDEYGIKEKDVIGRNHYEVFPDLPQKWRDVHQKALAGIVSSAEDDPYVRADGTIDWTRWECRPWFEADGSIGGLIVYTEIVTERKKAQDAIRTSLREKEVLLKEIHHRVKNNMQVISSLLNLQAAQFTDSRFREALKETQRRIRSMALLHEKLYKSGDLSRINFVEYAQSLAGHIFHSFLMDANRISLKFEMEPAFFDLATANPLGLILNELFSNAVKHAFPGGRKGEICVGLRRTGEDEFVLTVRDDGIGLPPDFDLRGKSSFGVQIIDSLASQLNGTMTAEASTSGSSFELRFRELHYMPRLDPEMEKTG